VRSARRRRPTPSRPSPDGRLLLPDDGPQFDHYLRTGDLQPPIPDETIPTSETVLTPEELDAELFHAAQHRRWMDPWQPTDEQQRRLEARAYDAEFSPATPERIADLNAQAATYYQQTYRGSWAQTYLTDRLGTDLTSDPHIQPGYAPAGFTTLVTHLRRHGATDDELLAAGLAKTASTGKPSTPSATGSSCPSTTHPMFHPDSRTHSPRRTPRRAESRASSASRSDDLSCR